MTDDTAAVLAHLRPGIQTAVTMRDLSAWTNLPRRTVESAVQTLRLEGFPVCTSTGEPVAGVYLASTPDELRACYEALRRRALTQLVTARALRRSLRAMESVDQPSLGLVA